MRLVQLGEHVLAVLDRLAEGAAGLLLVTDPAQAQAVIAAFLAGLGVGLFRLGLSISYNIVRDFGGTLAARNHPEGGAVFSVDLAASDARTSSEAVAAQ